MPGDRPSKRLRNHLKFWLPAGLILILPWIFGGQNPTLQLLALGTATLAFMGSLWVKGPSIRIPLIIGGFLTVYILVQSWNPAWIQVWHTGLRIWELQAVDFIPWLPSSIRSDFEDASPMRFLVFHGTAFLTALACYSSFARSGLKLLVTFLALNAGCIGLAGLIQLALGSQTILGVYPALNEGQGLYFATFLYKNHAAAFLNLGLAASLAAYFYFTKNYASNPSTPRPVFVILGLVILAAVIFSKSRFGFLGSLGIVAIFLFLALAEFHKSGISKRWLAIGVGVTALMAIAGGSYLLKNPKTDHLDTLNREIMEDISFKQRKSGYQNGWAMFAEKPILGWGAGNFRHGFRGSQDLKKEKEEIVYPWMARRNQNFFWEHMHNDYLESLIELGVVGTALLFSIPGYFFWIILKSKRWKDPVIFMLLAGLGSTAGHALVDFPFRNLAVLVTWFSLLIITARLAADGTYKTSGAGGEYLPSQAEEEQTDNAGPEIPGPIGQHLQAAAGFTQHLLPGEEKGRQLEEE